MIKALFLLLISTQLREMSKIEPHNEQEYYWPIAYSRAAVVSTIITSCNSVTTPKRMKGKTTGVSWYLPAELKSYTSGEMVKKKKKKKRERKVFQMQISVILSNFSIFLEWISLRAGSKYSSFHGLHNYDKSTLERQKWVEEKVERRLIIIN